ncbi:hypothetical protein LCGC14_2302570 [marine sediment metagenome]|uniref:DNA (cytosine-5-)-methyltransferase n=1 Tax=marine sediment metagenome TaxID=412755 RepID=A0A0F9F0D9_9ZZZZ
MKILNLFAGIGGNRTLWEDHHKITAIEHDKKIAEIYANKFPDDIIIITDAYDYLEEHYNKFEFIWASPPCTTHTQLCRWHKQKKLPDMRLYSIIVFLGTWSNSFWCVENVIPYYKALIKPTAKVGRHMIWSNFQIKNKKYSGKREILTGLKLGHTYSSQINSQKTNDAMNPIYGKYILDCIKDQLKPKKIWDYFK